MNIIKKITMLLIVAIIVTSVFNFMSYHVWADNFDLGAFNTASASGAEKMEGMVNNTAKTIISIMRIACVTVAIVMLLTIAMKYMVSSAGDRAEIKKHAVHYVVGATILFAVTGILSIINNFAQNINS